MTNVIFKHTTPATSFIHKDTIDQHEIFAYFIEFLKHYKYFSDEDLKGLNKYWDIKQAKKNEMLFVAGQEIRELGFIVKGAVKLYKEYERKNQNLALLTEANFCTMQKTFGQEAVAEYNAVCTESAIFLTITQAKMAQLIHDRPVFFNYFSQQNENIILFLQNRLSSLQILTAQERYEDMLDNHPDMINRFTLTDIANFLGMKGETLSRIRNVISKKDLKIAS